MHKKISILSQFEAKNLSDFLKFWLNLTNLAKMLRTVGINVTKFKLYCANGPFRTTFASQKKNPYEVKYLSLLPKVLSEIVLFQPRFIT